MSFVDQFAPVEGNNDTCQHQWFNLYGGFIVETKWNPRTRQYETSRHPYNLPNTDLMPDN